MEALLESLHTHFSLRREDDVLLPFRKMAWEHFLSLGLPKRESAFQSLPLSELYQKRYDFCASSPNIEKKDVLPLIVPECKNYLVFVDGIFCPHLSALPKQVIVSPMAQAFFSFGHFLKSHFSESVKAESDPFVALNAALQEEGAFIYLPPQRTLEEPLQLLHIFTRSASPRIQLFLSAGSEMKLLSRIHVRAQEPVLLNAVMEVTLEEGAHFEYFDFSHADEESWIFNALRARLKRNSRLHCAAISKGARSIRHDFKVALMEENAEAHLEGLCTLKGRRQAHTHVLMEHQAPHCRSLQRFKGILNEMSQSSFEGKIYVHQKAQKTDAYQRSNYLLLDDRARAGAKPNLEIFADDVKASHGATVGQIDAKQLFYLKTRGLPEKIAQQLLVSGFCEEILSKIPFSIHELL
jgi:Fe-S cluster assembly protein SufD